MNKEDKKEYYGSLKVSELKKLLKGKGARVSGRNAELVDRLTFYDKNKDFGYEPMEQDDVLQTPLAVNYKDINSSSLYPAFTEHHLTAFLHKFDRSIEKANNLYNNGFLFYVRYSVLDATYYYIKAACKAEMKKHMQHVVDVSLTMDGEIQGSSCECPVGHSQEAHCKHVLVLLLGLKDFASKQSIILEETCTQKLQTFHHPGKKYTGSPIKAERFRRRTLPVICYKPTEDFKIWYRNYFRNLVVSRGVNCNMSIKQRVEPANTYAVEWDHSFYSKTSIVNRILKSLNVLNVSQEIIDKIELDTRKQSSSKAWEFQRSVRLTASLFHSCCNKYQNSEGAKSLVQKIMNPVPFYSKATEHGKIYEQAAVDKFEKMPDNSLEISTCGLFVSLERPYLGASPDRLLFDEGVIEVKCPYVSRHMKINEKTVPYLQRDSNNNLQLNIHHPYHYQVQGQLYATGRQYCDFIVYTFVDICIIPIKRDEIFITEMILKLYNFYAYYLKPALLEKYLYKNYETAFFHKEIFILFYFLQLKIYVMVFSI